jgi:hypothetical protein
MKLMQPGHHYYIKQKNKFKEKYNPVKKIIINTKEPKVKENKTVIVIRKRTNS